MDHFKALLGLICLSSLMQVEAVTSTAQCTFDTRQRSRNSGATRQGSISSLPDCQNVCLLSASCAAFEWHTSLLECWSYTTFREADFVSALQNDFYEKKCPATACTFIPRLGKSNSGATQDALIGTQPDCNSKCQQATTCAAYEWHRTAKECWLYTQFDVANFAISTTTDFYEKFCPTTTTAVPTTTTTTVSTTTVITATTACEDTFVTATDTGLNDGDLITSSTTSTSTLELCNAYCLTKSFSDCAATDFASSLRCYIFVSSKLSNPTRPAIGVKHSVRTLCDATTTTATPTPSVPACADTFKKTINSNQIGGLLQSGVNTVSACDTACLKDPTCEGYDYTTNSNQCWFLNTKGTITSNVQNVDHYDREICNITVVSTACVDTFNEMIGKQRFAGNEAPSYNNNPAGCRAFCLGESTCVAYEIDPQNKCYWHVAKVNPVMKDVGSTHKLYLRVPCEATTISAVCRDTFTGIPNFFKFDGAEQNGINDVNACQSACLDRTVACVGLDFNSNKQCYLHGAASLSKPRMFGQGVTHYVRNYNCNVTVSGAPCVDPFTMLANRNRQGGKKFSGSNTQSTCEAECLKTRKSDANACYGYDFNTQTNECYLQIGSIASTTNLFNGVNTFERQFVCELTSTVGLACTDDFTKTDNANAFGGVEKSGVNTEPACRALCITTKEGQPDYCFGYDFDGGSKGCWFQIKSDYTINVGGASGVTHYKRSRVCPSTVATPVLCIDQYNETVNKNAAGGKDVGRQTVPQCKALCQNNTKCFGFDHANGQCWVHEVENYALNPGTANGVTNFRRLFNCRGRGTTIIVTGTGPVCIPTFRPKPNFIVYGGIAMPGANTKELCADACRAAKDCRAFNYDKLAPSNKCYIIIGLVGAEIPDKNLDLFIKEDNCAARTTKPAKQCNMKLVGNGNVIGGQLVPNINQLPACLKFCLDTKLCLAIDFDMQANKCFWFGSGGLTPSGDSCCVHHQKECRGTCIETYNMTAGEGYLGGKEIASGRTVMECQAACTESTTCAGFDRSPANSKCYMHTAASVRVPGARFSANGINHYRRVRCPTVQPGRTTLPTTIRTTLCPERYTKTPFSNGNNGVEVPASTEPSCKAHCTRDKGCAAIDFNKIDNKCYVHKLIPLGLNSNPSVDHFIKVPCKPVTPPPVTPAPVTPAPVTPAPVTPAPVTPSPVTPAPTTCNIDLGFILESSASNTPQMATFQRAVMAAVIGSTNFAYTGLRVSTRRFGSTSEEFLSTATAQFYNRSDIVGIVQGRTVNANYKQIGKDYQLALNGYLYGRNLGGKGEYHYSQIPTPGARQRFVVIMSDLTSQMPINATLIPDFKSKVSKIMVVPISQSLNRVVQSQLSSIFFPFIPSYNVQSTANQILSQIRSSNALCIAPVGVVATPAPTVLTKPCRGDVVILVDDSGSVRDTATRQSDNWKVLNKFVVDLVGQINTISSTATRVGVAKFSTIAIPVHRLSDVQNKVAIQNSIRAMLYAGGASNTVQGFELVNNQFFTGNLANGDRPTERNLLIVITDGPPTPAKNSAMTVANQARLLALARNMIAHKTDIIMIGVTQHANHAYLQTIQPAQNRRFNVNNFNLLSGLLNQLKSTTCNALRS